MSRAVVIAVLLVGFLAALTLLHLLPYYPIDVAGWALLVGVGTPAFVLIEVAGEALLAPKSKRRAKAIIPGGRLVSLLVISTIFIAAALLWPSIAQHFRSIAD